MTIGSNYHDQSLDVHYVTIIGTKGELQEQHCDADFTNLATTEYCSFISGVNIGEYRCMKWRINGNDGSVITKVHF